MRNFFILATMLFATSPAFAFKWNVDPVSSKLTFEGEQSGEKFSGGFSKFTSVIEFDEAAPEKGSISVTIDMTSVTADSKDRQDALPTSDWFDVKKFATATFTSTSITAGPVDKTGIKNYIAKGDLTIRGIAKKVELPFSLQTTDKSTVVRGGLTLNRQDYGVGQGEWKSDAYIKNPVKVSFELHASH